MDIFNCAERFKIAATVNFYKKLKELINYLVANRLCFLNKQLVLLTLNTCIQLSIIMTQELRALTFHFRACRMLKFLKQWQFVFGHKIAFFMSSNDL